MVFRLNFRCFLLGLILFIGCYQSVNDPSSQETLTSDEPVTPSETETSAVTGPQMSDLDPPPDPVDADKEVLATERQQLDESVWSGEVLAQQYEQAFVRVWDDLLNCERRNRRMEKYQVLARIPFDRMLLGTSLKNDMLDWGISKTIFGGEGEELDVESWKQLLKTYQEASYELVQAEFHHSQFDPDINGTAESKIAFALYGWNSTLAERVIVKGDLHVQWREERDQAGVPVPRTIDATNVAVLRHSGEPAFEKILTIDHARPDTRSGVQPVLVYDLDGDGLSELCLGGSNELLRNVGNGQFNREKLMRFESKIFEAGVIADFDGDKRADLVVPAANGDLLLYPADENGRFEIPPIGKTRDGGPLVQPQALTAGDIDADGDLDLWLAQYKISYVGGQMPTPYFDANDGFPAYLLINDGKGRFEPATEEAGLAAKRFRRTYGSSFLDLDTDGDLDLLVISDFSGVDAYANDGKGYFTDVTDRLVDERHLFGMSATFADYNLDGELDFFVTGMASTTARRLDYMKLGRRDAPQVHMMRSRMGFGNRMFVAAGPGKFVEPKFRQDVARTGWAWGSTSFDFDNDGDKDIFVANGHSSGESTKDHCTQFWCHDIYTGSSEANPARYKLFQESHEGYFDRSESWDGYQKNVLLMNIEGERFESVAFLLGVGEQFDGRAVVGDDVDNDGRVDLIVVEDHWSDGQLLHVYQNRMETGHHWIGVRLAEEGLGKSPQGARVIVNLAEGPRQVGVVVTGDSIHAQHPTKLHFGLGATDAIVDIEVIWPGGHRRVIKNPAIDRYHVISWSGDPAD